MHAIGSTHHPPSDRSPAARVALLRHTLPDGKWHFDWLLQHDPDPNARAATFRLTDPVHQLDRADGTLERLPDHRSRYFEYEGPISGGRGAVVRVAAGDIRWAAVEADQLIGDLRFRDRPLQHLSLLREDGHRWRLDLTPADARDRRRPR